MGILYLENNLATGVFTGDRLEVLRLLCAQAAISLENAQLYQQLENYSNTLELKVETRTEALKQENRERQRAEDALQNLTNQLRAHNQVLIQLARNPALNHGDLPTALRAITAATAYTLTVERVSVWLYNPPKTEIECLDLYQLSAKQHSQGAKLSVTEYPAYFEALAQDEAILADCAHSDPRTHEFSESYLTPLGIASMLDVPIVLKGQIFGVLCVEHVGLVRHWSPEEENFVRSVADLVSLGIEGRDRLQAEERIRRYTAQLEASNQELEAFAYSVSHDLRAPLRAIDGFSKILMEDYGESFDREGQDYFTRIHKNVDRMGMLIDDLLSLSRVSRSEISYTTVNLSTLAQELMDELLASEPERQVEFVSPPEAIVSADATLMRVAMSNLLQNAWKFTSLEPKARIEFSTIHQEGEKIYCVRDNGAGFDMNYAQMLFGVFQRLHRSDQFPGTGIGLATVQRVIHRHGGRVWAEAAPDQGANFYFTLPQTSIAMRNEI